MSGLTWNRREVNVEKGRGKTGKERRMGERSRKGWYPIPHHYPCRDSRAGKAHCPRAAVPLIAGTQDWAWRCWQMPAHDCWSLRAKDIYHSTDVQPGPAAVGEHGKDHGLELDTLGWG